MPRYCNVSSLFAATLLDWSGEPPQHSNLAQSTAPSTHRSPQLANFFFQPPFPLQQTLGFRPSRWLIGSPRWRTSTRAVSCAVLPLQVACCLTGPLCPARTDARDASDTPSASNFLEREKAILGADANQFATVEDADFDEDDDDLLGGGSGGGGGGNNAAFEAQFPDLSSPNEVCEDTESPGKVLARTDPTGCRASHLAAPSPAPQSATTQATRRTPRRRKSPR